MVAEDLEHIKAILSKALEKESDAERKAYLDEVCGAEDQAKAHNHTV